MTIYIDLVIFLNIAFDFILLLSVSLLLKRNVKLKRIILGSIVGGVSILCLFININSFTLFLIKIIISILMIITTFSYKNIKYTFNNIIYLYLSSIILGGFLYLLNIEFSYRNEGLIFINNGLSINFIVLIIVSPIILYIYVKNSKKLKLNYNNYYKVDLVYKGKVYKFNGFLDTGNKLYDQYKKRPIIIVNSSKLKFSYDEGLLVPYNTTLGNSLLKCIIVDKIIIDNKFVVKNVVVGLVNTKFNIDGVDMILHSKIIGGYND